MGKFWISSLIIIITLVLLTTNWWFCQGCLEEERFALLQLKSNINNPNGNSLSSWIDNNRSDCCEWPNVVCDTTTKRVVQISLNSTRIWVVQGDWHFNASLFLPFKMLRVLSLEQTDMVGWVENQGFAKLLSELNMLQVLNLKENSLNWLEKLPNLSKLEILNLEGNKFNRSVLLSLSGLTSLKSLKLGHNSLDGSGDERLQNLKRLEFLSLDGTGISDLQSVCSIHDFTNLKELDISQNAFQSLGPMHGLSRLEILHAGSNNFNNTIFPSFKQFPSLRFLDLSTNQAINGSVEINELLALEELDLSCNRIDNFVTTGGLPNLESLHLRQNRFNNSVFSSLKQFPSLVFLDLAVQFTITGSLQINELLALTNLEELDLSNTGVEDFFTTKGIANVSHLQVLHLDSLLGGSTSNYSNLIQSLSVLSSLKTLYFRHNHFLETHYWKNLSKLENLFLDGSYLVDKNVLNNIGGLMSLKVISLSECGLSGTLPKQGWCELKNIQELRLSGNELNGVLPPCLGNLTSLRLIDLSSNQFFGNIAISPLSRLTSLESLTISNNQFQVPFSFESFSNHSNLKFIFAANNEVILETSSKNSVPSFKLEFFSLSNCVGQYHRLPSFLLHQNQLRIIDLTRNNVGGDFPNWLLENNTKLEGFYMGGNAFKGYLKFPKKPNFHIGTIDISGNNISGQIPNDINIFFPNIIVLNMSGNNLVGSLPSSFWDLNSLEYLDLSNNNLMGELPQKLATCCYSLQFLKLSNNKFQGQIVFPGALNTYSLSALLLDNNNFASTIPDDLSTTFTTLMGLDLSNNHLHGKLPKCIGNMSNIYLLSVSNNQLEGPIPIEFCKLESIMLLDMSDNMLSGSIPSCFNPGRLAHLYLSKNKFGGQLTQPFCDQTSLALLDLSDNNFRGKIPGWIGNLSTLNILLLKGNYFKGVIPSQLCQLSHLSILDLSYNNLSGPILHCLDKMALAMFYYDFRKSSLAIEVARDPKTWTSLSYLETSKLAMAFHLPLAMIDDDDDAYLVDDHVAARFTSKLQSYSYKRTVLQYMSGFDLSCNQLSGNIPSNLGKLSEIRALNLSHNNLTGDIPITLSGLAKIESLDLSYNKLNGIIPAQLIALNFLEVFSVAHNNLSGPIPDRKAQFATFDASSYEGNALLCGPPLSNLCTHKELPPPQVLLHENGEEENNFMDMKSFYISFFIAYTVMLVTVVVVLCINPYWRRTWFSFIELCAMSCYDYVWIAFLKFKLRMRSLRSRFM